MTWANLCVVFSAIAYRVRYLEMASGQATLWTLAPSIEYDDDDDEFVSPEAAVSI